jgi:septal ring factor EnvC (AmiA/AmiB activator)
MLPQLMKSRVQFRRCWLQAILIGTLLSSVAVHLGCTGDQTNPGGSAQIEQELQQLREASAELQRLRTENQELTRLRRDNEELQRLREQTQDLAKLRAENEQLRAQLHALKAPRPRP